VSIVKKLLLAAILAAGALNAQTYDCRILFSFNTAGPTASLPFDNRSTGCNFWTFDYQAAGLSALTITVQSADGSISAGTFGTFSGTVLTGVNPNTSTTKGQTTLSGFTSWVRVNFSGTASGTVLVNGVMYGFHSGFNPSVIPSGCVGTSATPCVVDGPTAAGSPPSTPPVLSAGTDGTNIRTIKTDTSGDQIAVGAAAAGAALAGAPLLQGLSDGTNVQNAYTCTNRQAITVSAATDVTIITATAAKTIRICHLDFSSDTTANMTIRQGTGTTCGTTQVDLTGAYQNILGIAEDYTANAPLVTTVAARDVCLHFSTNVTAGGVVIYAVF
jgi:hypothetical protein